MFVPSAPHPNCNGLKLHVASYNHPHMQQSKVVSNQTPLMGTLMFKTTMLTLKSFIQDYKFIHKVSIRSRLCIKVEKGDLRKAISLLLGRYIIVLKLKSQMNWYKHIENILIYESLCLKTLFQLKHSQKLWRPSGCCLCYKGETTLSVMSRPRGLHPDAWLW